MPDPTPVIPGTVEAKALLSVLAQVKPSLRRPRRRGLRAGRDGEPLS